MHATWTIYCTSSTENVNMSTELSTNFLIMKFSPSTCYFLSLQYEHSPQFHFQKPSVCVLHLMWHTKIHTHKEQQEDRHIHILKAQHFPITGHNTEYSKLHGSEHCLNLVCCYWSWMWFVFKFLSIEFNAFLNNFTTKSNKCFMNNTIFLSQFRK